MVRVAKCNAPISKRQFVAGGTNHYEPDPQAIGPFLAVGNNRTPEQMVLLPIVERSTKRMPVVALGNGPRFPTTNQPTRDFPLTRDIILTIIKACVYV